MRIIDFIALRGCKHLLNWSFLENGNAQDLQNGIETSVKVKALFNDGDENVDRNGNPYLGFHCIL